MKTRVYCLFLIAAICRPLVAAAEVEWLTSVPAALERARAENKTVLLDFTGSDWCHWCKKLKSEVFDQPEFADYARANLIMVEVDFPKSKPLSPDQTAANQALAKTYSIHGYPTVILLDASGNKVGQGGYVAGGPAKFIEKLESNPQYAHHAPTPAPAQVDTRTDPVPRHEPAFVPVQPAPPMRYGDLALKAISGTKNHRFALINNQTLETGETGKVKTHDERVEITVKEIRDDSVTIIVDGKTRELRLGDH